MDYHGAHGCDRSRHIGCDVRVFQVWLGVGVVDNQLAGEGKEPAHSLSYRLLLIGHEYGCMCKALGYAMRFPDEAKALKGELKLAISDMYTQLRKLVVVDLEWSEEEIKRIGEAHLREKFKEFKQRGWVELAGEGFVREVFRG